MTNSGNFCIHCGRRDDELAPESVVLTVVSTVLVRTELGRMTLGLSDGQRLYAVRYSSERQSRTLYHSKSIEALEQVNPNFERFSTDARAIVSEPLSEMSDYWTAIPESTALVVEAGEIVSQAFEPRLPH